jgi:plasmid stability protein
VAAMTIRKISDDVHAALKKRAQLHGRSAEAEARQILEAELIKVAPPLTVADVVDRFRQINGGGIELPFLELDDAIEPATFE